jgi:uncharacterized protein YbcC (UPF0753/DUF2309 family)
VNLDEEKDVRVYVFDLNGKLVEAQKSPPGKEHTFEFNFEHLSPGLYLIDIRSENFRKDLKIIVN